MMLEVILCQSFCQSISNLVFGINREYFDESHAHIFCKNDDNKHLCAWSLGKVWEALQVLEHLSCLQTPCSLHKVQYK